MLYNGCHFGAATLPDTELAYCTDRLFLIFSPFTANENKLWSVTPEK